MPVRPLLWVVGVLCIALLLAPAFAADHQPTDPLVRVLESKGILTQAEADSIGSVAPADQRTKLAQILLDKGLISTTDYEAVSTAATPAATSVSGSSDMATGSVRLESTSVVSREPEQAGGAPKAPPVIPAVAPIRVLQFEPSSTGGLVPDIKLGSGAKLKLYGFLKATAVHDSYDQQGNDFPLPGFLGDTDPEGTPGFHLKARAARVGVAFEWPDLSKDTTLTGKLEFDFEGNFTRANNRNISSVRSSVPSLRLAYMRIDHHISDKTSVFALFGQDWTPFASSTVANIFETTGFGISAGMLYTREPQFRVGLYHNFGGSRNFGIGIEPAITLPAWGLLPTDVGNQLGYGERMGTDSGVPGVEGRVLFQWQLDMAKGVAPAQLIFSGMWGRSTNVVLHSAIAGTAGIDPAIVAAFPNGARLDNDRNGWTAEIQLPTRFATLIAKYWGGRQLRWFFADGLFLPYNNGTAGYTSDAAGLVPCTLTTAGGCPTVASIDGAGKISFGFDAAGNPVMIPQTSPRARGGVVQLSFPLSRIFHADPMGRNAGWTLAFAYGLDNPYARDVRFFAPTGARDKNDMMVGTLTYRMNQFANFGLEVSNYRTRSTCTAANLITGDFPGQAACPATLYRGLPARETHDLRVEFGPVFTF